MRGQITGSCWSAGTHTQTHAGCDVFWRECVYKADRWFHRTLIGKEPRRTLTDNKQHRCLFTSSAQSYWKLLELCQGKKSDSDRDDQILERKSSKYFSEKWHCDYFGFSDAYLWVCYETFSLDRCSFQLTKPDNSSSLKRIQKQWLILKVVLKDIWNVL